MQKAVWLKVRFKI